jgi:hypothetical protein
LAFPFTPAVVLSAQSLVEKVQFVDLKELLADNAALLRHLHATGASNNQAAGEK